MTMTKRVLTVVLAMVLLLAIMPAATVVHAAQSVKVATKNTLDNGNVTYVTFASDMQPVIIDGRVYVSLKGLEGVAGIDEVTWMSWPTDDAMMDENSDFDKYEKFACISSSSGETFRYYMVVPGSNKVHCCSYNAGDSFNGFLSDPRWIKMSMSEMPYYEIKDVPVTAKIINDRVMIPLRMLEIMGCGVSWDANTSTVLITYSAA